MTSIITLLLVLTLFIFLAFVPVAFHVSIMKQTTLELAHHRALQLASERGYLDPSIIQLIRSDLKHAGFPPIEDNGIVYPAFPNSTTSKVLRGQNVHVELVYPAPNLQRIFNLLGGEAPGSSIYYRIKGDMRSEALE